MYCAGCCHGCFVLNLPDFLDRQGDADARRPSKILNWAGMWKIIRKFGANFADFSRASSCLFWVFPANYEDESSYSAAYGLIRILGARLCGLILKSGGQICGLILIFWGELCGLFILLWNGPFLGAGQYFHTFCVFWELPGAGRNLGQNVGNPSREEQWFLFKKGSPHRALAIIGFIHHFGHSFLPLDSSFPCPSFVC